MPAAGSELVVHASCVALEGRGVLILGPSGSGKSGLALQLMAFGARLVADDRTVLRRDGAGLVASCPAPLVGLIEARGVGLLRADPVAEVPLHLAVDLGQAESDRLPPRRSIVMLDCALDLVLSVDGGHFPAAILRYVLAGREV
ncbi:HPr kinase/phosphatase C-terminal domain-containing protein [Paracoccaceae bacterium Fryx2]|nr:HPr kinase/phosphatase C-terminal domain-containing protein [Paracoccaceae bacterium Fryx2]